MIRYQGVTCVQM